MLNRVYISGEEAIKKQSFFAHFDYNRNEYIFIKDFCGDNVGYEIYNKESKEKVCHYLEREIVNSDLKYYILKNTNITAY